MTFAAQRPLRTTTPWLALLLVTCLAAPALAADESVSVSLGGVTQIDHRGGISSVSIGDPEVADINPVGNSVIVKGKRVGTTTLVIWSRSGRAKSYMISVQPDVEALRTAAGELFPSEEFELQASGESLVLRGRVTSLETMDAINDWVLGFKRSLGEAGLRLNILNRLVLPGSQQVQLEIRFAEVSRTGMRKLGINLTGSYDGHLFSSFASGAPIPPSPFPGDPVPSTGILQAPLAKSLGILFIADPSMDLPVNALLSALNSRGVSRSLSEPSVVALSGMKASFTVGGEFPVPIPMGQGQISIEYKKYGVLLGFQPTVLSEGTIQVNMKSEVKNLDWANAVGIGGWKIPSLISRSSQTTVRLKSGQSFAVAGLLSDNLRSNVDRIPVLGELPIVGMLFRTQEFLREEVELVVVCTVRLVEPVQAGALPPLPGEGEIADPNDLELFLMGWEDVNKRDPKFRPGRPAGNVGFRK